MSRADEVRVNLVRGLRALLERNELYDEHGNLSEEALGVFRENEAETDEWELICWRKRS